MEARQVYVFLMRRAQDGQAWPAVYESRELAEKALGRTTAIAPLCFDEDGNVLDLLLDAARQATARAEGERDEARAQIAALQRLLHGGTRVGGGGGGGGWVPPPGTQYQLPDGTWCTAGAGGAGEPTKKDD